jgi:hypothetical protein
MRRMRARRVAGLAVTTVLLAACMNDPETAVPTRRAPAAEETERAPPHAATDAHSLPQPARDCEESVSGDLGPSWRRFTILAGPVGFVGRSYATAPVRDFAPVVPGSRRYRAQKVLLLVRRGTRVEVEVVPHVRSPAASLLYDSDKWNDRNIYRVTDGDRKMTFRACDGVFGVLPHSYTQFNGSFVVAGPGCVHVDVRVPGERVRYRAVLSFGAGDCR